METIIKCSESVKNVITIINSRIMKRNCKVDMFDVLSFLMHAVCYKSSQELTASKLNEFKFDENVKAGGDIESAKNITRSAYILKANKLTCEDLEAISNAIKDFDEELKFEDGLRPVIAVDGLHTNLRKALENDGFSLNPSGDMANTHLLGAFRIDTPQARNEPLALKLHKNRHERNHLQEFVNAATEYKGSILVADR